MGYGCGGAAPETRAFPELHAVGSGLGKGCSPNRSGLGLSPNSAGGGRGGEGVIPNSAGGGRGGVRRAGAPPGAGVTRSR